MTDTESGRAGDRDPDHRPSSTSTALGDSPDRSAKPDEPEKPANGSDDDSGHVSGPEARLLNRLPMWGRWLLAVLALYLLIVAVGLIGDGFSAVGEDAAESAFDFAANPIVGLFVGILATSLVQSSSTTTAITVTAVGAGALPVEVAVPIIMGANIGTSVTNTLASLGHAGNRDEFRRAFAASTVHDFFNIIAVLILLPLELLFHPIQRSAEWLSDALYGTVLPDPGDADVVGRLTDPVVSVLGPEGIFGVLPNQVAAGIGSMILGVVLIFLAVRWLGKILQTIIIGRARTWLKRVVGGHPSVAMGVGMLVTVAAQSSSVTTSTMVPFAGSGALTTREIYPLTLGANVGTTATGLIAALAVSGGGAQDALTIALVHLLFNVFGIGLIYVLPFLRGVPVWCAEKLAAVATAHKSVAAVWIVTVFLAVPAAVVLAQAFLFS